MNKLKVYKFIVNRKIIIIIIMTPSLNIRRHNGTFVTWEGMSLFNIVPYLRVPIVLRPSHSLLPVFAGICLYVVHPNNMTYANIYMIRI